MDLFTRQFGGLSHAVVVVLIKIRLLVDPRALHRLVIVHEKLPRELVDNVRHQLVSNIIAVNRHTVKSQDLSPEIKKVESQHCLILDVIDRETTYDSRGDEREMQLYLVYSYDAWKETSGAIDVIREKTSNKL
ncbi:hypothetical protein D6C82_09585 [Aureobasidium pullulans]|nr:hypothetical protein D6C82_09585 [Aureobasidium pullulans]